LRGGGAVTVVPRLVFGLASRWENTTLEIPPGRWRNELTGDRVEGGGVALASLMVRFPVSLLVREEPRP
jgi:(1->4)-alpha-D-glucan 1-alpha-D-glucosylmutase